MDEELSAIFNDSYDEKEDVKSITEVTRQGFEQISIQPIVPSVGVDETDHPNKASIDSELLRSKLYPQRDHPTGDFIDPHENSSLYQEIKQFEPSTIAQLLKQVSNNSQTKIEETSNSNQMTRVGSSSLGQSNNRTFSKHFASSRAKSYLEKLKNENY